MRASLRLRLALPVLLGMAATALASQFRPNRQIDWAAPAPAAAVSNPLAATPAIIAGGTKVFEERCAQCHGRRASGSDWAPDLTSTRTQRQSDGALFWKLSSGNAYAGMPGFSYLPPAQRWQLVLYLREAAKREGAR